MTAPDAEGRKRPEMRTLDLYLTRRFLLCLGIAVVSLLLIAVIIDLTENIDTFIDFEARPKQILLYYVYRVPYWLILTLPIAALLGALFALTSLARQNEITAMKATGIGLYRLLAPVLACALAVAVAAFFFTDRVVPAATYQYNQISDEIKSYHRSDGSRRQVLLQDADNQFVYARSYDAGRQRADEVSWERLHGYVPLERAVARRMEWREGTWVLLEGRRFRFAAGEARSDFFLRYPIPAELVVAPQRLCPPAEGARGNELCRAGRLHRPRHAQRRGCHAPASRFAPENILSPDQLHHDRPRCDPRCQCPPRWLGQ